MLLHLRLDEADALNIARLIGPDITACIICVITAVVCFFYQGTQAQNNNIEVEVHEQVVFEDPENPHSAPHSPVTPIVIERPEKKTSPSRAAQFCIALLRLSDFIFVLLLALVAVIWPCVLSAIYFLTFLLVITWWSVYLPLKRPVLNGIKIFLLIYSAAHLVVLYLYQLQVFQQHVEPFSFAAK